MSKPVYGIVNTKETLDQNNKDGIYNVYILTVII